MSRPLDPALLLALQQQQQQQQTPAPWRSTDPAMMTPAPPPMVAHPVTGQPVNPHLATRSLMDPAIREAQARIALSARPNPQPLMGPPGNPMDPSSVLGQMGDVGHMIIQHALGAQPFGAESPDAYQTMDVQHPIPGTTAPPNNLLSRLAQSRGEGRFQTGEPMKEGIAMPVLEGPTPMIESTLGESMGASAQKAAALAEKEGLMRAFGRMRQYMRPEVADSLKPTIQRSIAQAFQQLPSVEEWEAAARAGVAKRGWYKNSGQTIKSIFGDDTPTFTGVLAAQSPRQKVAGNLKMAIDTFGKWVAAGRPQDEASIRAILEEVPGATFPSRVPNTLKAFQGKPLVDFTDPESGAGYKVESFRRNLLGEMDYATNDTWMQKWLGQLGEAKANFFGNRANYLATDARTRQVAQKMGWSTAEVQETIWSFIKSLTEKTPSSSTLMEGLKGLTHETIGQDADFAQLLRDPDIAGRLRDLGFQPPDRELPEGARTASSPAFRGRVEETNPRVLRKAVRRLTKAGLKPGAAAEDED